MVIIVRDGDGEEVPAHEIDTAEDFGEPVFVEEVLDPFTHGIVAHSELFGDLGDEVDWAEEGVELEIEDDDEADISFEQE